MLSLRRQFFDVRPGEHLRTWSMFAYLLCVLFAYYILKPVSRAMFLNQFDIDKLPSLYILIAVFGGTLAYLYSRVAVRSSLRTAVFWAMTLAVGCLVVMWWLIRMGLPWMIYVLNVWVSLFSIVLVSQGWLVASNLFNSREAKRLYALLGLGMVLGAASGGEFTRRTAVVVGTENLLLASAVMVVLAYVAFRVAASQGGTAFQEARAADQAETDFRFRDVVRDISRTRHLQVIIGMMVLTYMVDVLVEYQFQAMAKAAYQDDQLTAFFGMFYGLYLNLTEFVFQLFLTGAIVKWFGVGGTLQIMPATILVSSTGTVVSPGVTSTAVVRLTEASTRYTFNRTGMELLYLPLPVELRNRIKAFIDIFVDRMSRGLGGVLLIVLTATWLNLTVPQIALVVMGLTIPWILLSLRARHEYVATVRRRLESRRLDLATARITVRDPETIRLLEGAASGANPRQASYALSLLSEAPNYDLAPLLRRLVESPAPEIRAKVYELAQRTAVRGLLEQAQKDVGTGVVSHAAVEYILAVAPERRRLAAELLNHTNTLVAEGAVRALESDRELAEDLITRQWLDRLASDDDALRRALAATAVGARGDHGTEVVHRLLADPDPLVARAACRAAGRLRNRAYAYALIEHLATARVRGDAIDALAQFGSTICGTLGDVLIDETSDIRIRRQIPRVLKHIPDQRSVDVLLSTIGHQDLSLRAAALKALNRLREVAPQLNFENTFVTQRIAAEARYYFELSAALEPFRERKNNERSAAALLARTIDERLNQTLERLFRLLGLRYPPKEIHSAYLAVSRRHREEYAAALEFLDNVLERDLKRILLPLLDAPEHVLERGRELFGIERRSAEDAIRELIRSRDPWLVACAMAAAAELKLRSLAPEISQAATEAQDDVSQVARSASAVLAPA
jgi:AAA family ATP:ADP antiporter